jgi:hypothetical protein
MVPVGVGDGLDHAARAHEGVVERLREIVHGGHRAPPAQHLDPMRRGSPAEDVVEDVGERRAVGQPRCHGGKARIVPEFRRANGLHQPLPEFGQLGHHEDPAIGGLEQLRGRDRGVRRARAAAGQVPVVQVPEGGVAGLVQRGLEQGDVIVRAPAGRARGGDTGKRRGGQHLAGHEVDHGEAEAGRRGVGLAGEREEAGLGLHEIVVAGPGLARVAAAVGRGMDAHDRGIDGRQGRVGEAELFRLVAAGVVGDRIGPGDQPVQDALAARRLEIEGDRALVEVEGLVEEAVVLSEEIGPGGARAVAAAPPVPVGRLELDHLGAELGQHHRAIGPRAILLEAEDPDAGKRQGLAAHAGFRFTHCLATIMRCISLVPSPMHMRSASR